MKASQLGTIVGCLAIGLLTLPVNVDAGIFGPDNFPECVLSRLPSAANDTVALEIASQCSRAFPVNAPVEKQTGLLGAFNSGSECTLKKAKNTNSALASRIIRVQCYRLYERETPDPANVVIGDRPG